MPSIRVSKELNQKTTYFLTFTIKNWYYVLDRYHRWEILANSLKWYQKNRDLKIYGFVFMINHLHLIVNSPDTINFIKGFKSFTARTILENIKLTEPNLLKIFFHQKTGQYELWKKTNMPKIIVNEKYLLQKLNYIYENPVKRNYVAKPEDWYWSGANPDCELKTDSIY